MLHTYPVTAAAAHLLASAAPINTKDAGDPLDILAKKFGDHVSEVLTKLGATNGDLAGIKEQLAEMEQKAARGGGYEGYAYKKTIGEEFTDNPELKTFSEYRTRPSRFSMGMKATITSATASGEALTNTHRDSVVMQPQRRLAVRDLIPTIRVTEGSVEYPRQTTRTNAAAPVAEGASKPESEYAFEMKNTPIRTIAHWIPASRQVLDDAPQLRGLIDTELMYGLKLKEDSQLLAGDGTGQNLFGLIPQATAYSAPITLTSPTMIDQLGLAILQNALAEYPADGIIVHPSDWMRMRLLKNADGEYILGDPAKDTARVLFGLPVVDTTGMTIDKFLVGSFQAAATIYDRWDARIEVSTEHADFFTKNLVAILCEERLGLAVKRPTALTYGDFGNVA
ncbi:phage major capsid protein [Rhizobium sp. KVB221]|uniref:Phage major capsid protein n=1 Tax=Rhizobium setariae TaxID=2801340 RepID=A0A936YSW9_9HYPH|nr:phage major capsid protein [Rhizobium setariae]MBL0375213.1 phage major capsid protein [Rhizobium setariae]